MLIQCGSANRSQVSQYAERHSTFLLVGELVESVGGIEVDRPLPYFAGALAAQLLVILDNPVHCMYGQVNEFLLKGPVWNIERLPSYWINNILLHEPSNGNIHQYEVDWLLTILLDGLQTSEVSSQTSFSAISSSLTHE